MTPTVDGRWAHLNPARPEPLTDAKRGVFGTALKRLREDRRVSQSKLAERAGFDHSYVSRLESGARTPTRDAVVSLAGSLQLDAKDQDRLLAAAGFLPKDTASLLADEPEVASVLNLLADPSVSMVVREAIRTQLAGITVMCRGDQGSAVAS